MVYNRNTIWNSKNRIIVTYWTSSDVRPWRVRPMDKRSLNSYRGPAVETGAVVMAALHHIISFWPPCSCSWPCNGCITHKHVYLDTDICTYFFIMCKHEPTTNVDHTWSYVITLCFDFAQWTLHPAHTCKIKKVFMIVYVHVPLYSRPRIWLTFASTFCKIWLIDSFAGQAIYLSTFPTLQWLTTELLHHVVSKVGRPCWLGAWLVFKPTVGGHQPTWSGHEFNVVQPTSHGH